MVFLAGWSQSTGAVASSQGTAHGSTAGQEDAAFTPLGASLVGRSHMEGSDPHRQGVKGGRNPFVQRAV